MKNINTISARKKTAAFVVFYILSILLVILFFTVFSGKSSPDKISANKEKNHIAQQQLSNESDILLLKLKQLQKADERYAALFVQSKVTPAMDSVDTKISKKEADFKNVLDSFNQVGNMYSGNDKILFQKLNDYFKQSLESRRTIGNIRYALAAGNFDFDANQQKLLKLNSDLIAKNDRIKELEDSLQSKSKMVNTNTIAASETDPLKATVQRQQSENDKLKLKISSLNNTIADLQSNLEKKKNEITTNSKDISSSNSKNVELLNAQIDLANINCNLIRADVQQIISNSKQRKKLLSDALKGLTKLSKSNNRAIQNEANIKLKELQRIAETVRD